MLRIGVLLIALCFENIAKRAYAVNVNYFYIVHFDRGLIPGYTAGRYLVCVWCVIIFYFEANTIHSEMCM